MRALENVSGKGDRERRRVMQGFLLKKKLQNVIFMSENK